MALREVLADLDVKVRGLGAVRSANVELDQYVAGISPARGALDGLKIKQAEAAETASLLAQRIRALQKAEGNNAQEILETRQAYFRAEEAAKAYGRQIEDHVNPPVEEGIPLAVSWADALQGLRVVFDAGVGVARAFADQIRDVVEAGSQIDDLSNQLGVNARRLQEWGYLADQSGTSLDTITRGLEGVTRSVHTSAAAYRRLGVATRGPNGELRRTEDILNDSLTALAGVSNETERATLAQRLFGGANRELLGVVRQGPEELARLRREFEELGGGMSAESIAAAADTGDALNELRLAGISLRDVLTPLVLPAITSVLRELSGGIATVVRVGRETTFVTNMWRVGSAVVRSFAPQLRLAGAALRFFLAPWVGAVVLIDDVVTALDGGHSALGRWTEEVLAANGHVMTFQGFIQSLNVDLLEANATLLELSAEMGEFFAPGSEYAAGLRTRADSAITGFRGARDDLARDEAERFALRGRMARGAIIGAGGAKGEIALRAAQSEAAANITRNTTININGGDLNAVRRVIREERASEMRDAADALPLAEGA